MMDNGWGMHGMWSGWMWFIWPLLIVGIVVVVVLLLRHGTTSSGGRGDNSASGQGASTGRTRAQEILDERYARGEITEEEYRTRGRHLREETD